jgi:hypothetical protein
MDIEDEYEIGSLRRKRFSDMMKTRKLPPNMVKLDTHKLLKDTITLNNLQNKLLNTPEYNEILNDVIKNINLIFETVKQSNPGTEYNYFIAGSRAWNSFFKDFYELDIISPYEKSSIHNTNADLYYFINDKTLVQNLNNNIKLLLKRAIQPLADAIKKYVDIEDSSSKNVYIIIEEEECKNDKKSLIPSKRLYLKLHIDDSVPQRRQQALPLSVSVSTAADKAKKAEIARKKREAKKAALAAQAAEEEAKKILKSTSQISNRELRASKRNKPLLTGGAILEPISKIILSVDIYYSEKSTISQDNLLVRNISNLIQVNPNNGLNYLNLFGLYIFLQLSKKKIFIPKGYNIFKIREIVFDKLILFDHYRTPTLKEIIEQYYKTFNETIIFDNYLYIDLQKLYALSFEPISSVINSMEIKIIDELRPYMNKTIKDINDSINLLNSDIGLFVAGGDALRRYKNDISVTKDIDCKIYIPKVLSNEQLINRIKKIIVNELINLVCYLIENIDSIFSGLDTHYENDLYKINYTLSNEEESITNFRFRQIFKDPFPVDLYSLDYRCKIEVEVKDNLNQAMNTKYNYNYDIAFLDVVIEILDSLDIFYKDNAVLSNDIPISKLEFLLKDLKNTYNNDTSSLLRFIGGKITKDYQRYNALLELIKNKKFIYSTESLIKEKRESPDNENLYVMTYRKIETGEEAEELLLPVLFEKNQRDDTEFIKRCGLDLIHNYNEPNKEFRKFYYDYYKNAKIIRRKIMYSFDINELKQQLKGGTKLDNILIDTKEELEILEKSLCSLDIHEKDDDISSEIINDLGEKRLLYDDEIEKYNIDNYITDIMSPHNKEYALSDEKINKFYNKLANIIKLTKIKRRS